MKTSPSARSKKRLIAEGYIVAPVERYIAAIRQRKDVWGFGDLLAAHPYHKGATLVQTTTASNFNSRLDKVYASPEARTWLECGNRIIVHGWSKRGPRGGRKEWECREVSVSLAMLDAQRTVNQAFSKPRKDTKKALQVSVEELF